MNRGSCVRCEEVDGVIIRGTDSYCSTCFVIEFRPCECCGDKLGSSILIPMRKNNYTDLQGFYCERCII